MSNYSQIKGIIDAAVYENHQQAITGDAMNTVLNGMVSQLGAHYKYEGYASPSTDPGTPDENVFYLATEQGAYPNFGNLSLTKPLGVFKWDGSWSLDQIAIDTGTAAGLLEKVNANTAAINAINAKIPPEASTDNKLADKAYVDRAVSTNTGTFVGTFGSVSELPTDDVKANDYAYVVEDGVFKRYKYNGSEWLYEYSLDNTAFSDYVKAVNITAQGIEFDFAAGTDKTFLIDPAGGLSYGAGGLGISSLKSTQVIAALGYTPFDASQFTAQNIVSTLGNTAVKEALHALNADTAAVANKVAHPLYFYDADSDAPRVYDGSAVVSVTIPSAEQIALWDKICALFDVDGNGDVYVTGEKGFYTNSFLSARGADPESGGGGGLDVSAMWAALAAGTSEQINLSHLPSIPTEKISGLEAASVGYASSAGTADRVRNNLTVKNDGGVSGASDKVYNGSAAVTISIPTSLPASDVYDWAKQPAKPSYTFAEIGSKPTTLAGYGITDGVNAATASGNLTAKVTGHSLAIGVASGYEIPSTTRTALWDKICALFDIDADGNVYVTGNRGFYGNSFLSARGADPEAGQGGTGGLDIDAMWDALATSGAQKIDASHIPALGLLSGTISNAQLANSSITVAGVEVPLGGAVTTAQIATALTTAGYKLTDTTYGLATDTVAGLVKIGYLAQVGTKNYGVKLNPLGQMYVSVPWTDTVTTLASLGITATAAELNFVDGVTSNIQTQLNAKANASALAAYALKDGSNASGTWGISISGNASAAGALTNNSTTEVSNRLRYHQISNDLSSVGSTAVGGAWVTPPTSQDSIYGNGQILRLGWAQKYYTDIFTGPNGMGSNYGIQVRQVVNSVAQGWRILLDTSNYAKLISNVASATKLAAVRTLWGQGFNGETNVSGDMTGVGSITMSGNLICGTAVSSDIRNSFRSSIFGNSTRGFRIKEVRTDVSVTDFCTIYGASLAWAGEDTHGWLAVGFDASTKLAYIGGGNADKINWSEQLWHSGNSNLSTVSWAANNLTAAGQVSANNGFVSSKNNTYALTDANTLSNGILAVSTKIVGQDTVQPMITWSNNVSSYGFITRYSISSVRPYDDQWGRMRLAVGANDTGTLIGCYLDIDGNGFVSISKALEVGTDATISGNLTTSGTIYSATGIWSRGWLSFSDLSSTSDRRFKDGIAPLAGRDALAVIRSLKPSTWTWNALAKVRGRSAGFVAQDVAGVLPDAIREIGDDRHLALNYQMLHAYEVAALQEHDDEIQRLRKRVDFLEDELKRARSWRH